MKLVLPLGAALAALGGAGVLRYRQVKVGDTVEVSDLVGPNSVSTATVSGFDGAWVLVTFQPAGFGPAVETKTARSKILRNLTPRLW